MSCRDQIEKDSSPKCCKHTLLNLQSIKKHLTAMDQWQKNHQHQWSPGKRNLPWCHHENRQQSRCKQLSFLVHERMVFISQTLSTLHCIVWKLSTWFRSSEKSVPLQLLSCQHNLSNILAHELDNVHRATQKKETRFKYRKRDKWWGYIGLCQILIFPIFQVDGYSDGKPDETLVTRLSFSLQKYIK